MLETETVSKDSAGCTLEDKRFYCSRSREQEPSLAIPARISRSSMRLALPLRQEPISLAICASSFPFTPACVCLDKKFVKVLPARA